jgi:hypothetical protein
MPLSEPRNRLLLVTESATINGVDFIGLRAVDATTLFVHFVNTTKVQVAGISASISGGDRIRNIQAAAIDTSINSPDWTSDDEGRPILAVHVDSPGDFSTYTLIITGAPLDPFYDRATFSFKVLCPAEFDCAPVKDCCAPQDPPLPAIDYTAKDFQSFKLALTDFSAQRFPAWQQRSEADFGVMFMEALCALADEFSYLQDRIAAESSLLSATQRRSLVSMARLVDYEPQPSMSATTIIQCNVIGNMVPAGALVTARRPDGVVVPFEIGTGLSDGSLYAVSPLLNDIQPYWLDDSQQCLPCKSTQVWVQGHGLGFVTDPPGTALLIQTDLPGESIREVVHVISALESFDGIFLTNGAPTPITLIGWSQAEALTRDHDLTQTRLAGNLLPATQGQRFAEPFAVGTPPAGLTALPSAIARHGPNGTDDEPHWIFRYPLSKSSGASGALGSALSALAALTSGAQPRLTWLFPPADSESGAVINTDILKPLPELAVNRRLPEPQAFSFATSLLDATATDTACTVDPAAWRLVAANSQTGVIQWEYDGDQGDTLRFGDGTFGAQPNDGDVFDVVYRIGLGADGNVAADSINTVDHTAASYLSSVRNPFAATNGQDPETAQRIQRMAPQAFRAGQYRAVRAEDYQTAAQTLPFVLKAATSFRWTGSWLTVFTTVDAQAGASLTETQQKSLIELLNRRKLAGYESYAPPPDLVSIDLRMTVCAQTGRLARDVEAAVLLRLAGQKQPDGGQGFFSADAFTFGTPLYRSRLEAAIQGVPGVKGVLAVTYRQRGGANTFEPLPEVLAPGPSQILRVRNDPDFPEQGTIRVTVEGGR